MDKIKEGISEKLAIFAHLFASFVICVVFPLFYGWELTLLILICTPFIIITTAIAEKVSRMASLTAVGAIVLDINIDFRAKAY